MKRGIESWSEEKIRELVKDFTSKTEFAQKFPGGVAHAKNIGIWDDLFPKKTFPPDDEIIRLAMNYDTQNDFRIAHPSLYTHLHKKGLLNSIMFKKSKKKSKTLTDEDIINRAKEYQTFKEFYTKDNTAYRAAKRKGEDFYREVTSHMS